MPVNTPIYMDHHATTPVDPRVVEAMLPYFTEIFGNAASIDHLHGHAAQEAVERSRGSLLPGLSERGRQRRLFSPAALPSPTISLWWVLPKRTVTKVTTSSLQRWNIRQSLIPSNTWPARESK